MDSDDSLLAKIAASPARAPRAGTVGGTRRFELRRRLGAGSFGEVFEARDRESGVTVAVKLLKAGDPDRLFRFKREFRAVADIAHPNLVRLHELIQEDDRWYLTMELVDGLHFDEHLRRAPEQIRTCFAQLAQAIGTLHRAGSIHRDIKPNNVLVERTGRVVLLDFGLARALVASDQTAIAGTPQYMAPEHMTGGALTEACDWYAFGVMLYETLAGVPPFAGIPSDALWRAKCGRPPLPSTRSDGVDPDLESLCMGLLSAEACDRPDGSVVLAAFGSGTDPRDDDASIREREPFAGRTRELEVLRDLSRGVDETGAIAFVEGHAGIGKTSLVQAFERDFGDAAVLFFRGRCHEAESVPFKGIDAVVDAISELLRRCTPVEAARALPRDAAALAAMFPVLKRVSAFADVRSPRDARRGPLETRRAALRALRELVERLSDIAPVVIVVDDVQWATEDVARLLAELVAAPTPPALFIVAYRAELLGSAPALDRLLAAVGADGSIRSRRIALAPLDHDEVRELLAGEGELGAQLDAATAHRETGGHPFLLSRLLRASGERQHLDGGLADVLDAQLSRLGESARAVLEVVALSAAPLTQDAACAAAGLRAWNAAAIDELRIAKLVRSAGRHARASLEPYHDHVREHVVASMSVERAASVHRTLAHFFETSRRVDAEAIAHHYVGAGDAERAIAWLQRAATAASESLAFMRAAELHAAAARLATDPDARIDLLIEHADAMVLAGRRGDAGRACLDACTIARASDSGRRVAELRGLAGEHFMLGGDFRRGSDLLREALQAVGVELPTATGVAMAQTLNLQVELVARGFAFTPRDESELPPQALRRLDLELASARALAQTDIRAPWLSATALHDALELGEPRRVQLALAYFAFVNAARIADHPMSDEILNASETIARKHHDEVGLAWAVLSRGIVVVYRRDIDSAVNLLRDAERRFLTLPRPLLREAGVARIGLVTLCASYGYDLRFAREMTKQWIDEALEREDFTPATWLRVMSTWIDLAGDDVRSARENLRLAREAWSSVEDEIFTAAAVLADLAIAVYADPPSAWDASERIATVFNRLFASMLPVPRLSFLRQRASAALAAFVAGRADLATTERRVTECIDALASNATAADTVMLLHAHLASARGDRRESARLFTAAADGFGARKQNTHRLLALLRSAQVLAAPTDAIVAELSALGVVDPDRYGHVFAGPPPAFSGRR